MTQKSRYGKPDNSAAEYGNATPPQEGQRVAFLTIPTQSGDFLVLPVVDQIGDHGWIGERGCVTQRTEIILGDLSQNPAHDLARPGLGQAG